MSASSKDILQSGSRLTQELAVKSNRWAGLYCMKLRTLKSLDYYILVQHILKALLMME